MFFTCCSIKIQTYCNSKIIETELLVLVLGINSQGQMAMHNSIRLSMNSDRYN